MTNSLENLLQQIGMNSSPVAPGSRYYGISQAEMKTPDGKTIAYLRRRIIPPAEQSESSREHMVSESERLDNITASHIGDPEQFWQIADYNYAMKPEKLTGESGKIILLP
jgi:hypothetical protein